MCTQSHRFQLPLSVSLHVAKVEYGLTNRTITIHQSMTQECIYASHLCKLISGTKMEERFIVCICFPLFFFLSHLSLYSSGKWSLVGR